MPGHTIALVGCVKTKRAGRHPARDLYQGNLFLYSRQYAERHAARWFILSAKYGLVDPLESVEPYEETLKGRGKLAKAEWAERVFAQMRDIGLDRPENTLIWLAGRDYMLPLAGLLKCRQVDPLRGKRMGERVAWLKSQT